MGGFHGADRAQKCAFIILALITRCDPIYLRRPSFFAQRDILSDARVRRRRNVLVVLLRVWISAFWHLKRLKTREQTPSADIIDAIDTFLCHVFRCRVFLLSYFFQRPLGERDSRRPTCRWVVFSRKATSHYN